MSKNSLKHFSQTQHLNVIVKMSWNNTQLDSKETKKNLLRFFWINEAGENKDWFADILLSW